MKLLKYPNSCEECIKNGYNEFIKEERKVGGCPYEFLQDVKKIIEGLKRKYGFEDATLVGLIPQLESAAKNCLENIKSKIDAINAEAKKMERLKELMGIDEMTKSIEKMKELIEMTIEQNHRLLKIVEKQISNSSIPKSLEHTETEKEVEEIKIKSEIDKPVWRTWARNVKKENIEKQKQKIFDRYPNLTENDLKIFKNKLGNYTIMFDLRKI